MAFVRGSCRRKLAVPARMATTMMATGLVDSADPDCVIAPSVCEDYECGPMPGAPGVWICQDGDSDGICTWGLQAEIGAACSDGYDNDGDGLIDSADPDCATPPSVCEDFECGPMPGAPGVWICQDGDSDGICTWGLASGSWRCLLGWLR